MNFKYFLVVLILSVLKLIESNASLDNMNCSNHGYNDRTIDSFSNNDDHKTEHDSSLAETRQSHLPPDGSLAQICK